jgi:hypothetical protein
LEFLRRNDFFLKHTGKMPVPTSKNADAIQPLPRSRHREIPAAMRIGLHGLNAELQMPAQTANKNG